MGSSSPEPFPEKRRVACDNCKRAKHRCVVDGEKDTCQRCAARNEECTYKIKSAHLELDVLSELSSVIDHVSEISRAFNCLVQQLSDKGLVTLGALPTYDIQAGGAASSTARKRPLESGADSPRKALRSDRQDEDKHGVTMVGPQRPAPPLDAFMSPTNSAHAVQHTSRSTHSYTTSISPRDAWVHHESLAAPSGQKANAQEPSDPLQMLDFVSSSDITTRGTGSSSSARIGDADPRQNIVKKGIVDGAAAYDLVET